MKKLLLFSACLVVAMYSLAQAPDPLEVANAVSNLWFSNNLIGLSAYATNIYSGATTNYLPAIMVSIFHDRVFEGKLVTASNKLCKVNAKLETAPGVFSDRFKYNFSILNGMSVRSISEITAQGLDPNAMPAEPQLIHGDMGSLMIPDISILYDTPAVMLP
jgi:hypothetical protein